MTYSYLKRGQFQRAFSNDRSQLWALVSLALPCISCQVRDESGFVDVVQNGYSEEEKREDESPGKSLDHCNRVFFLCGQN